MTERRKNATVRDAQIALDLLAAQSGSMPGAGTDSPTLSTAHRKRAAVSQSREKYMDAGGHPRQVANSHGGAVEHFKKSVNIKGWILWP